MRGGPGIELRKGRCGSWRVAGDAEGVRRAVSF